jgi:hypothetical protein
MNLTSCFSVYIRKRYTILDREKKIPRNPYSVQISKNIQIYSRHENMSVVIKKGVNLHILSER